MSFSGTTEVVDGGRGSTQEWRTSIVLAHRRGDGSVY